MLNRIFTYAGYLLFGLILIIPYQMQFVKLVLALLLLLPYFIKIQKKKSFLINGSLLAWILVYVFMGLFYIVYAFIQNNPAPMTYFPIYVLWPILFYLLSIQVDYSMYMKLISCMRNAFTLISILGIIAFLKFNLSTGDIQKFFSFVATVRPGFPFIAISSGTITNMIFLYTFFFTIYIIDKQLLKKQDYFNLVIGFVFVFATSRRAFYMVLAMSILFSFFLVIFYDTKNRKQHFSSIKSFLRFFLFFIMIVTIIVIQLNLFDFKIIWEFISDSIGSNAGVAGYDPRLLQYDALIEGWMKNPLFGNGTGINASIVRSEIPGMYELSYIAILFERGLLGISVYIIQFLLLNYWAIKNLKKNNISASYNIATLVAFDMFMFANATNPYLYAFDHLWIIFTVLIIINLKQKSDEKACVLSGN